MHGNERFRQRIVTQAKQAPLRYHTLRQQYAAQAVQDKFLPKNIPPRFRPGN